MSDPGLRVLIVAENASTRFGGEAILPYHYFRLLLARGLDVHLIVHARTRPELLTHFAEQAARLHFIEDQTLQKLFFHAGKLLPRRVSDATFGLANHLLTQSAQRSVIRRLVTPSTVIHQPIPVSPRFPSLLYSLGAPVVIGPLNGGMEYPSAFRKSESAISRALIAFGRSLTDLTNALLPGKRRASVVLIANSRTRAALPSRLQGRILELPENAVDEAQWTAPLPPDAGSSRRFVFIGRLVDWKALDIVLDAMRNVPAAELEVIGDGPMLGSWRQLAAQQGLSACVHFRGWQSQTACAEALRGACALVLPSIYECGGAVVLEAMASAIPVIATAWGGPVDYLNSECGILIAPTSRADLIAGFASAMDRLLQSTDLRARMGAAGRERVLQQFSWSHKIDRIQAIYESTLPARVVLL